MTSNDYYAHSFWLNIIQVYLESNSKLKKKRLLFLQQNAHHKTLILRKNNHNSFKDCDVTLEINFLRFFLYMHI